VPEATIIRHHRISAEDIMSPIVRWLMAIAMVGPVVAADPIASVQLAEDDDERSR
jgi:hypothetical protein